MTRTGRIRYFSVPRVVWTTAQVLLKWQYRPLCGRFHVWAVGVVMLGGCEGKNGRFWTTRQE